jgi:hypothetical protein
MKPLTRTLLACLILIAVFSLSFAFFYKRARNNLPIQPLILTPTVIGQPLPKADLINISGEALGDDKLRRGRVVLIFSLVECEPCDRENDFLKTIDGSRKDVRFYYVIPFGIKDKALAAANKKYVFETFFDNRSMLSRSLQVSQVPIKVFVEDGIMKKTWADATVDEQRQAEFRDWLNGL